MQSYTLINLGVALTLHGRAGRQGTATCSVEAPGLSEAPGPHSQSSASACLNVRVREAKWLQAAFDGDSMRAKGTRRWHISTSTSHGASNRDVTKAALVGSLWKGRHKDICRVLSKWRQVVKDGVLPDSCTADLVAFLQRKLPHQCPSQQ